VIKREPQPTSLPEIFGERIFDLEGMPRTVKGVSGHG